MEELIEQYNVVFDSNGNIKPCGRQNCSKLITICKTINNTTDFGDENTGVMNIENIKMLVDLHRYLKEE